MSKMIFNGLEFVAGQEINNNGMFVDFDNLITSGTYIASTPLSYTAIVDCYILVASINWGGQRTKIYIDGIEVNNLYSTQTSVQTVGYFLKKGQVCTATTDCSQENSGYAVYGLQSGSVSNVQHNYSTSEQLIGTWDGKPLYEKTFTSAGQITTSWRTALDMSGMNIDKVLLVNPTYYEGSTYMNSSNGAECRYNGGNQLVQVKTANYTIDGGVIVTIRYTKTTD